MVPSDLFSHMLSKYFIHNMRGEPYSYTRHDENRNGDKPYHKSRKAKEQQDSQ